MIKSMVEKELGMPYENRLLIFDNSRFSAVFDFLALLCENGYKVFNYDGIEEFRLLYEERIKTSGQKIAVVVSSVIYVPYDIRRSFYEVELSVGRIFPKLHTDIVLKYSRDLDIIGFAYNECYSMLDTPAQTEVFIEKTVFSLDMILQYGQVILGLLEGLCSTAKTYTDWIEIAKLKARLEYYDVMACGTFKLAFIDDAFAVFLQTEYAKLSGEVNRVFPPILTKTLQLISGDSNEKTALIIMDGMSLFDFEVLSRYMNDFEYDYNCSYALIPTTTSVSRQSLLSGKYPQQLSNPFSLSGEEKSFVGAAESLGYTKRQIQYSRGFEPDISPFAKLVSIIVNDVDNIVHGQHQGHVGMLNDMIILAKSGKLQTLVKRLFESGFSVFITADHGNTLCTGVGVIRGVGVEVETRSKRMVVLKDFAEESSALSQYTTRYPAFYLDKSYRYYICNSGISFDNKNDEVMTHGGMSINEVIVPFIKIKAVK